MRSSLAIVLALCLGGCAAFRSYDKSLQSTVDLAAAGDIDGAIKVLETANPGDKKDLLYFLELGMLQRLGSRVELSQKSWTEAADRVQGEEERAAQTGAGLASGAGSLLVNDKLRPYEGYDYEKVMLLSHIALNQLATGDFDQARVSIKRAHELEATIADQRGKQVAEVKNEAEKKGAKSSFKDLNGYPIETIDNPEVNALRNSYQSALSHFLAGFVYEALGEPSLAAPGYRQANELQPNKLVLEQALGGLDARVAAPKDDLVDVLFVIGAGTAPALQSKQFRLGVPTANGIVQVAVSFPVIAAAGAAMGPTQLSVDAGSPIELAPITSIDLMARRRLKDDMPGIMLRTTIRAASRALVQNSLNQSSSSPGASMFGAIMSIAASVGSLVAESADERTWRMLPAEVSVARARLPAGRHSVALQTTQGDRSASFAVAGRYAVVDLRLIRGRLFVNAPLATPPSTAATPTALELVSQPKEATK
jgi:hypothetical protein